MATSSSAIDTVVRRGVALASPVAAAEATALQRTLEELDGVRQARVHRRRDRLTLRYDVMGTDYGSVLAVLAGEGCLPHPGLLQRLRSRLFPFLDANARANATARPGCCNRPPAGYRRR